MVSLFAQFVSAFGHSSSCVNSHEEIKEQTISKLAVLMASDCS